MIWADLISQPWARWAVLVVALVLSVAIETALWLMLGRKVLRWLNEHSARTRDHNDSRGGGI